MCFMVKHNLDNHFQGVNAKPHISTFPSWNSGNWSIQKDCMQTLTYSLMYFLYFKKTTKINKSNLLFHIKLYYYNGVFWKRRKQHNKCSGYSTDLPRDCIAFLISLKHVLTLKLLFGCRSSINLELCWTLYIMSILTYFECLPFFTHLWGCKISNEHSFKFHVYKKLPGIYLEYIWRQTKMLLKSMVPLNCKSIVGKLFKIQLHL